MVYFRVLMVTVLVGLVHCEPPVQGPGYNYNAPGHFNPPAPSNNYLPPSTGYHPQTYPSGSGHDYQDQHNHGHGHDNEVPKSYEFGYSVKDAQTGNDYNRRESSDGNVVRGEYRVALPDGRTQIVTYHADWKTGFHADVRYEGEARYPEPSRHQQANQGYNYPSPDFSGSLTGFQGRPSAAYGPPGYHH